MRSAHLLKALAVLTNECSSRNCSTRTATSVELVSDVVLRMLPLVSLRSARGLTAPAFRLMSKSSVLQLQ